MTKSIKVPKEVQDVFAEVNACRELARCHAGRFFPSVRELAYTHKALKLENFALRTLGLTDARIEWTYNPITGTLTEVVAELPVVAPAKKTRKPRAPKAAPAAQPTTPTTGA